MTETDKAYTAGVIDSDGSIGIQVSRAGGSYWLIVNVTQKDVPIVRWLEGAWNGSHLVGPYEKGFCWYITGQAAAPFLEEILPYLTLKKREAEVGIEFQEFKDGFRRIPNRAGRPYPLKYQTQGRAYYELMRALKDRSGENPPSLSPLTDPQLSFLLLLEKMDP